MFQDTAEAYGIARDPKAIELAGTFGKFGDEITLTEAQMWAVVEEMREYLDVDEDERLEFFLYYNDTPFEEEYRKFKGVLPGKIKVGMGDDNYNLWQWQMTLPLLDDAIYDTAPTVTS